jgi:glycine/D-amino acid oxidase-like deaminating enzyme/nitrite reductase/ring-hydroxylating ferredoxin subunit
MTPNTSIWLTDRNAKTYSSLKGKVETDVVIVGAGITGLTAAYRLCKEGRQVMVLEQGRIGDGTTGRTTAHLSTMYDGHYSEMEKVYDRETSKTMAIAMNTAIDLIEQICGVMTTPCSFKRLPGYLYAEEGQDQTLLNNEYEAGKRAGLDLEYVTEVPLPFRVVKAIKVTRQGQFHPIRYLQGLAELIVGTGKGQIFENTRVTDFSSGHPLKAICEQGAVSAKDMILATHTPLGFNLTQALMKPMRSYVVTMPSEGADPDGLFWDMATPYHYIRYHTADNNSYLIVGGKDHATGHPFEGDPLESLKSYVMERFGQRDVMYGWNAQYYDPEDLLPFIGKTPLPLNRHFYIATGYSGDGMTIGTLAGSVVADLILGHENAYEPLFHPLRVNMPTAKSLVTVGYHTGKMFIKDRMPHHEAPALGHVEEGQGGVTGQGMQKALEYRAPDGSIRSFEASCPHMGCILTWNEKMNSFDCPCHGSRFDVDGMRIEGPSLRDLTPLKSKKG